MQTQKVNTIKVGSATELLQANESSAALEALGGLQMADYQLTKRLGAGGYGEVWEAIGPGGLPKAVKILYGEREGSHAEAELKALERMKDLRHPFLLNIERIEVVNSRAIVVTELADGNLSQCFERYRKAGKAGVPRDELLGYLKDAADALDFMSEKHGLQHLDIKPDNILVQGDHAKVGDFGLAKDLNVTNVSIINGFTPTFAAPELFEGRPGRASDQYSLAIVYQYMLTGVLPFNGRTAAQLTAQHLRSQPDLGSLQPIDRPVIARALSKNTHSRFDSCRQFVDELSKRKHSRAVSQAVFQQDAPTELHRTALLKTKGSADEQLFAKKPSVPVQIRTETADGKSLRPALFIGVGGLAGHVLKDLKQQLHDCRGDALAAYPLLQIDTDRSALSELKLASDGMALSEAEVLPIPLRSSKEYRSASGLDLSWMSRRWLFNIPRSGNVEGIRPLGRLALYDHRRRVRNQIQQLLTDLQSLQSNPTNGLIGTLPLSAEGIDVYIVAATSGGTSSGAATDVGLMVQSIARQSEMKDVSVHGILLHGTGALRSSSDVQDANTVCMLNELTHLSTPGLPTPQGFDDTDKVQDVAPFDETWLVHMGDGLSGQSYLSQGQRVSTYLFDAATTAAQLDFRAWRACVEEQPSFSVRTLGMSVQDADFFRTASSEGGNLCSLMLRRWCGYIGKMSEEKQYELPAELTDTHTLIEELKLTDQTLPRQVKTLLSGECGKELDAFAGEVFERLAVGNDLAACNRSQLLDLLSVELSDTKDAGTTGRTLHGIVSNVQKSLSRVTQNCELSIRQHLIEMLDTPHRLEGCNAAIAYVLSSLTSTVSGCQSVLNEIESAFTALAGSNDSNGDLSVGDPNAARMLCREYCVLLGYQTIYHCFLNHVRMVSQAVTTFGQQLHSLKSTLESLAADMASSTVLTGSVPQPIIDAFDRHVRTSHPQLLTHFLSKETSEADLANALTGAATHFLMAATGQNGESASSIGDSKEFPNDAWPGFKDSGGRRRVLGMVAKGVDQTDLEFKLRKEFGDCVATREVDAGHVSVVCEVEGVPVETILGRLTHNNPHIADVASRVHTRIDIDW